MASVSLLLLTDSTVAPHLALIRRICNPQSTSKPHITVRYFDKLRVPNDHFNTIVTSIDLLRPGSFDAKDGGHKVVFIQCDADELVDLEHKPHFPASDFHITLYEGSDAQIADDLLDVLREFKWMFRVHLPDGTTLTHVTLKLAGVRDDTSREPLESQMVQLFFDITNKPLTWRLLDRLTGTDRVRLARQICVHLHHAVSRFPPVGDQKKGTPDGDYTPKQQWEPDIYLTPPELAISIAKYAVSCLNSDDSPIHFGDPAVGNGAFFGALRKVVPKERIRSAVGIDISHRQVEVASSKWGHRGLHVIQADYLHMERLSPRNLILANPPYVRHQNIPVKYKRQLRERASVVTRTVIDAKSGQYVYFLLLSHQWLVRGGVSAWLIPSGFMYTVYGRGLRRYLATDVTLIRIHQFGANDRQFENAKVLPTVVVFRNTAPEAGHVVTLSAGGSVDAPESSYFVSSDTLRKQEKWSIPPLYNDLGTARISIGDLFRVRRGIATGANDFFVLERQKARSFGIPDIALRPVLPKSRDLTEDVVERRGDGWPDLDPQLCVIDCNLTRQEIGLRYPKFSEYLDSGENQGLLGRNLLRRRKLWYQQEKRLPAIFLCTYMGRGSRDRLPLRFIWNKSDAIVTNTYLMMYPNEQLRRAMDGKPSLENDLFGILKMATNDIVDQCSRVYFGGLRKIEPRELLHVGLPNVPDWLLRLGLAGQGNSVFVR